MVFETPHESPAADVTFEEDENEESPQEERHSAYDATNAPAPITEIHAADTATDEIVSVKDDTDSSNTYGQTEEKSVETLLEEEAGQERLPIAEEKEGDTTEVAFPISNEFTSSVYMTTEEAAEIILNLCDELGKKGRHREGIALSKALTALYGMDKWRDNK